MISGKYWMLHDDDAIGKIDRAAMCLIERRGARIANDAMLDSLEGAGCRVDRQAQRCYFPEKLVCEALSHLGGKAGPDVKVPSGWSPVLRLAHGRELPAPTGLAQRPAAPRDAPGCDRHGPNGPRAGRIRRGGQGAHLP